MTTVRPPVLPTLLVGLLIGLLALAACAPAAPSPTAAPAKPAETKPAEAAKPAEAKPAAPAPAASPAAAPAASPAAAPAPSPAVAASPGAAPVAAPKAPASASGGPAAELNMAVVANINYAPYFVGVEKGLFVKHGIDLKIKTFPSAAEVIKAVQAGDAQVGVGTWGGIAPPKVQGVDLKIFYLIVSDPSDTNYDQFNAIVVRPGLEVKGIEDLAGKKIASSFGGGTDTYLRAQLAKHKVSLDNVTLQNVTFPNMLSALQQGFDAAAAPEPYPALIEAKLPGTKVLVRGGNVTNTRVMAISLSSWLDKNSELAERFSAASAEASQYARQNKDDTTAAASRFLTGIDLPILRKALDYVTFDPRYSRKMDEAFVAESKLLLEQKKMPSEPKVDDLLARPMMESLPQKYPQFFSDLKPL